MKKIVALLIMSIIGVSCTTSDDSSSEKYSGIVTEADIKGEWTVTAFFTKNGEVKTKVEGINVPAKFKSIGKDFNNTKASFSQAPNKATSTGTFTNVTTLTYLTFFQTEESVESVKLNGDWSLNKYIITITSGGVAIDYTIIDFTGNTLKLKYTYNEFVEVILGYEGQAKADIYITVTK